VDESDGTRLGRMMKPELITEQDAGFIHRFTQYVCADGFGCGRMVTRMERLKFETIVTGKSYHEVLAEWDGG
jgi:hypothetical protein